MLAVDVDRSIALGEDDAAGVRKLTLTYAGRISHNFGYGVDNEMNAMLAGYGDDA